MAGRSPGAVSERGELRPGDVGVNLVDPGDGVEAAVDPGYDVFPAEDPGVADDAFGDQVRVFNDVGCGVDHARHDHLTVRYRHVTPHAVSVLVASVGRHDGESARPRSE